MKLPTITLTAARIHLGVTVPLLALFAYNAFLSKLYPFGVQAISVDRLALFVLWSLSSVASLPDRCKRPSDLFWTFYLFLSGIWGACLWGLTGGLSLVDGAMWLLLLHLPAYVFKWLASLRPSLSFRMPLLQLFDARLMFLPMFAVLILAVIFTLNAASIGSFDFFGVYDRRIAGRDLLPERSLQAYVFGMAVNGVTVLLAYMAGRHRSLLVGVAALLFCGYAYWLLGLRSQFLNVVMLFALGLLVAQGATARLQAVLVWGMVAAIAIFTMELSVTGYSEFADYLIRRVAMVQPEVQAFYIKALLADPWTNFLQGVPWQSHSDVTYFIGETYLLNNLTNANTNGFFYALAKYGMPGYLLAIAVVSLLLLVLDDYHERTGISEFLAIAALYGILLAEQSYSAALFTSGILPCIIIIGLFSLQGAGEGPRTMTS